MAEHCPWLVCLTVPFPGNVFAAFRCARHIKEKYEGVRVAIGGGYVNTELRSVYDERVFQFVDFITLDDGEAPLRVLIEYLEGNRPQNKLKRTFMPSGGVVTYVDGAPEKDVAQRDTGTPDLDGLPLDSYLSVIELTNPIHRLWSDGRWNKLTLAHGCFWGKCSFCAVTLNYIARYEPVPAAEICDRMAKMIRQSGQTGFHFVDEAAPPALMRVAAIELIRRDMAVVWWTNIRFEKSFTADLCRLLAASGCIAVSGGLEVASDRLLDLMKKGVTVAQVARVARAFEDAGIMVHAYLMYGFPTQTDQETIDSMETVRQMFEAGVIRSGFWHLFAMTAHSPVGLEPAAYSVVAEGPDFGGFADNDRFHSDPAGADHEKYSEGLRVSLHNYMQGHGIDWPLCDWFDFEIPDTTLQPGYIAAFIEEDVLQPWRPTSRIVWAGGEPVELILPTGKKKKTSDNPAVAEIVVSGTRGMYSLFFATEEVAMWAIEVGQPQALGEGFSCLCMPGRSKTAEYLLDYNVDPLAGIKTGLNGFHYAASGGRLEIVKLLIERKVPSEVENIYGGTVFGQAMWSAVNEWKPDHAEIVEELVKAGAVVDDGYGEWCDEQNIPDAETKRRIADVLVSGSRKEFITFHKF